MPARGNEFFERLGRFQTHLDQQNNSVHRIAYLKAPSNSPRKTVWLRHSVGNGAVGSGSPDLDTSSCLLPESSGSVDNPSNSVSRPL